MYQMNREHYFDDRNLNREQRRALEKVKRQLIASYPDTLQVVPENDPDMPYSSHPQDIDKIYRSKKYTVIVWNVPAGKKLSIQRNEWDSHTNRYKDAILWDEIQEIKRQCGFGVVLGVVFFGGVWVVLFFGFVGVFWFFGVVLCLVFFFVVVVNLVKQFLG